MEINDLRQKCKRLEADYEISNRELLVKQVEITALRAERDRAREMVTRLIETGRPLCDYAILVSFDHPMGDGQMALNDKSAWDALVTEWQKERETC